MGRSHAEAPAVPARGSARVELARLALQAALNVEGVVSSDPGPGGVRVTAERGERLAGVVSAARSDGRYGVRLYLVARLVPLHSLAERVRTEVIEAVSRAGLAEQLGPVDIVFEDLEEPAPGVAA